MDNTGARYAIHDNPLEPPQTTSFQIATPFKHSVARVSETF